MLADIHIPSPARTRVMAHGLMFPFMLTTQGSGCAKIELLPKSHFLTLKNLGWMTDGACLSLIIPFNFLSNNVIRRYREKKLFQVSYFERRIHC